MKGISIVALLVAPCLTALPQAASAADGVYASLDLGQADYGSGASGSDTAYRLAAGYQFNPYLGAEAGYTDLGSVQTYDGICRLSDPGIPCVPEYVFAKAHGYLVEAKATWPLGSSWSLYAQAGGFLAHTDLGKQSAGFIITPGSASTGTVFTYGVGLAWASSETLKWHLGWDSYSSLGDSTTGKFSVDVLALGLAISFH